MAYLLTMAPKTTQGVDNLQDNWDFVLVGKGGKFPFRSYVSSIDPTTAEPGVLIGGAQNVYKNLRGNITYRPGLKTRGNNDTTLAGTKSSFEWETSKGVTRVLRVNNGKLQIEFDAGDGAGLVWRDLITGLSLTRFIFDHWWDNTNKKDRLLFAIGDTNLRMWGGGIGTVASVTSSTITLSGTQSAKQQGFDGGINSVLIGGVLYAYTDAGYSPGSAYSQTTTSNKFALAPLLSQRISQLFTTGASATQLLSVAAVINNSTIFTGAAILVGGIYTDNAGVPGTLIASVQGVLGASGTTISAGDFTVNFTFGNGFVVTPVTNYHFVLYQQSGAVTLSAYYGASGSVGTNNSTNGGVSWNGQNGYLNLVITENDVSTRTLIGVTPNPSALVAGSVVLQSVVASQNVPDPTFMLDFLKIISNQVHCGSYESSLVYVSNQSNYLDYTIPLVRAPGDPDLITLDSQCRGITAQKDKNGNAGVAIISGQVGDWYVLSRASLTVGNSTGATLTENVNIQKLENAELASALGHEFIANVGDNVIFLDQNNQLREFSTVRNLNTPVFPLLSLDVFTEFKNLDFTGGHVRGVADQGGETVYITCPTKGIHYFYQIRQKLNQAGDATAERLWHPPQVSGLSRIAVINGQTYGHSVANPMLYQIWDTNQWHDDSPTGDALPYECHISMAYLNEGQTNKLAFEKLFATGYMTPGSVVNCNVLQEYQGAKNDPSIVINDPAKGKKKARFYSSQQEESLGDASLGDNPLGDGIVFNDPDSALPKFRCIRSVTAEQIFEYALDVNSNTADTRLELIAIGVNQTPVTNKPVEIRKSD